MGGLVFSLESPMKRKLKGLKLLYSEHELNQIPRISLDG